MLFNCRNTCLVLIDIISSSSNQISLRNIHKFNNNSCFIFNESKKSLSINTYSTFTIISDQKKNPVLVSFFDQLKSHHRNLSNLYYKNFIHNNNYNMDKYSIIGFDLDGTVLRYNLNEMIPLEYNVIAKYLVNNKDYSKEILNPINNDEIDFFQKGLIMDSIHGNILKFNAKGDILKAIHGTKKILTDDEIVNIYGPERKWNISSQFLEDPLSTWNGPLSEQIRALLDYFDMPSSLIMARTVDTINEKNINEEKYDIYPDILAALVQMYSREHFAEGISDYFEALKNEPEKYILKTDPFVIENLKELKKTKATFLLTGSNIDFANLTATYALGPNWRDLFDVVITYAKKPGFFTQNRPFYKVENNKESCKLDDSEIKLGNTYSQGNWVTLKNLLATKFEDNNMNNKCVYVGDNLIQDVYTPKKYANIDTIAIVEELLNEEMYSNEDLPKFLNITKSNIWGSYFSLDGEPTYWSDIIKQYAEMCVPTIDYIFRNSEEKRF